MPFEASFADFPEFDLGIVQNQFGDLEVRIDYFVQLFFKVLDHQMSSIYWSLPTKTQVEH